MNIKKFFKVFAIVTVLLLLIEVFAAYIYVSKLNIGSGGHIDELDEEVKSHERKNVLVAGTDKSGLLADVLMIFSFSDEGDPVNVVSIQRDTEVQVGGATWKINSVLQKGKEALVQMVKDVTGIPIHDYIIVNFDAVKDVVDLLGGVDFEVPQNMDYEDPAQDLYIHLKKGYQHLDGENALKLLRFRSYPMADIQRTQVQRDFIQAMFEQKAKIENISKVEGIFNAISKNITSSLKINEVLDYVGMAKDVQMQTYEMPCVLTGRGTVVVDSAGMQELAEAHFIEEESYLKELADQQAQAQAEAQAQADNPTSADDK